MFMYVCNEHLAATIVSETRRNLCRGIVRTTVLHVPVFGDYHVPECDLLTQVSADFLTPVSADLLPHSETSSSVLAQQALL